VGELLAIFERDREMLELRTVIEHTQDQSDRVHGEGHYVIVHKADESNNPICGKNQFRDPNTVTSKRIFRLRCLECSRKV